MEDSELNDIMLEMLKKMPKCGCGRVGRYETSSGIACNKYFRCDNNEYMAEQIEVLKAHNKLLIDALTNANSILPCDMYNHALNFMEKK